MKLVDNLYAYIWQGKDNNCNSYLFANALNGKHILIDPGHTTTPYLREPGLPQLVKQMAKDGLKIADTGLVILTHSHRDHCDSARILRENGASVALHEADEEAFQQLGGAVDIYLDEGELELGKQDPLKLEIYHSPGHSPGHITVYWPQQKVLIAGDVLFYRSTGRFDLPGGDLTLLKQSIEQLSTLDIEYLLCGHPYGHPGILKGKAEIQQNFDFVRSYVLF